MKKVSSWQEMAIHARKSRPQRTNQEEFGRILGVSTSEVRRWEQGESAPTPAQAISLGKEVGPPDCWFWWELAGLGRADIMQAFGLAAPAVRSPECTEELALHMREALDIIVQRGKETVLKKVDEQLFKFARSYEMSFRALGEQEREPFSGHNMAKAVIRPKQKA
jgi:transcriptional regulator with XRE-family HTH domain